MTSPEDDGLEEALRRALSDAASEVEPGGDGLEKIRARIGDRPPRPWLLSVLAGLVDRVRHWTWRGHWAWQDSLPGLGALRERRSRRSNFPGPGIGWLRLVTVLAGVAVLTGIALGVQPVRHAISQASSTLNGGGGSPNGGAGTEGKGTQANGGATPTVGVASSGSGPVGQTGTTVATNSRTGTPHPAASGRCGSSALPSPAGAKPSQASATAAASASTGGAATATAAPAARSAGSATPAQPVYTSTNEQTCPVPRPTRTPTPTPTSSSAAPVTTPSDPSPTQAPSPTWTDPTPTSSGPSPTSDPSSPGPSDPPSRSWPDRGQRRHASLRDQHSRRR
jgi:hypothetical protein